MSCRPRPPPLMQPEDDVGGRRPQGQQRPPSAPPVAAESPEGQIESLLDEARGQYRAGHFHAALAIGERIRKTLDPHHVGTLLLLSATCLRLKAYLPWCVDFGSWFGGRGG